MNSETRTPGRKRLRSGLSWMTAFGLVAVALAACSSTSDKTSPTTSTSRAARPRRFEVRPVEVALPAGGPAGPVVPHRVVQPDGEVTSFIPDRVGTSAYSVGPLALTNRDIKAARPVELAPGRWMVSLEITHRAYRVMNRLASELFPKPPPQNSIVFVLDGVVQAEATFRTPHFGSQEQLEIANDGYTKAEARAVAAALNR